MGDDDKLKDYVPGARLCSKQAAGELFFTNFLHSIGSLTGFKDLIDSKVKTDHYQALEQRRAQFQQILQETRWKCIMGLFNTEKDIDASFYESLESLVTLLNLENDLNKKKIEDELKYNNFVAITSCIFLYIIAFVLIAFVEWK